MLVKESRRLRMETDFAVLGEACIKGIVTALRMEHDIVFRDAGNRCPGISDLQVGITEGFWHGADLRSQESADPGSVQQTSATP
jgi:hypothetical protein